MSCRQEDEYSALPNNSTIEENSNQKESSLERDVMYNAYAKYMALENAEIMRIFDEAEVQLSENKLNFQKSGQDEVPLGDIFFVYEGAINGLNAVETEPGSETETYEATLTVPVNQQNGQYFIEIIDLQDFLTNVLDEIDAEVGSNQQLALADLNLDQINGSTAAITISLVIHTPPATPITFFYPGGAVHAAQLSGWCSTPSTGFDAATFVDGFIDSYGALAQSCPTGTNKNPVYFGSWASWNSPSSLNTRFGSSFVNSLSSQNWQGFTNSCIGDDTDQFANEAAWYSLFFNALPQATDPAVINYYSGINPGITADFLRVDYHSHDHSMNPNPWFPNPPGPIPTYWHGGQFYYGKVFCF